MGSSENFRLKWNDYESSVSGAFRELRQDADFFDVSLSCDESHGRTLQAHKVILSACSAIFKSMLKEQLAFSSPTAHLLIYLRGVRYSELSSILDFVYQGEVHVHQDGLDAFLAVANDLQIKGLIKKDDPGETSRHESHSSSGSPRKRPRKANSKWDESVTPRIKSESETSPVDASDFLGTDEGCSLEDGDEHLDDMEGDCSMDAFNNLRDPNLAEGKIAMEKLVALRCL